MIELASKEHCTACGACVYICPKQCIKMEEDSIGQLYPILNDKNCITCKRCQKVCPILHPVEYHSPFKAYAAWSSNNDERNTSASGGIASEIYNEAWENNSNVAGAVLNEDFSVSLRIAQTKETLSLFKNSKYVYSSALELYPHIKSLLKENKKIVIIALPCQIAAIKNIFNNVENLLLVDLVCHGTTPYRYLLQHIHKLEQDYGEKVKQMSFRDAAKLTYTYTFTLYNSKNQCFYAKRTKDGDTYQIGYHRMISYRENCYNCHFAKSQRVSDITLSDYKGLGKLAPCTYNSLNVSSILINSDKGDTYINQLIRKQRIIAEERPVLEPIQGDSQLQNPSKKSKERKHFEKCIIKYNGDFEKSMHLVITHSKLKNTLNRIISIPSKGLKHLYRFIFK